MVRSLNPNYYSNSVNIAQNSEPYYISYLKLKDLVNHTEIDTILLGFSYHNLSTFNDYKLSDSKWSQEMMNRSYSIFDNSLLNDVKIDYKVFLTTIIENMCIYPKLYHLNYLGGYQNIKETRLIDVEKVIYRHFFYNNTDQIISNNEIKYLDLIFDLCLSNGKKLILVITPLHSSYRKNVPVEFVNGLDSLKNNLGKDILVLDYSKMAFEDDEFLNSDHLNEKGAKRFTKILFKDSHD